MFVKTINLSKNHTPKYDQILETFPPFVSQHYHIVTGLGVTQFLYNFKSKGSSFEKSGNFLSHNLKSQGPGLASEADEKIQKRNRIQQNALSLKKGVSVSRNTAIIAKTRMFFSLTPPSHIT